MSLDEANTPESVIIHNSPAAKYLLIKSSKMTKKYGFYKCMLMK